MANPAEETVPTLATILSAFDETWNSLQGVLNQLTLDVASQDSEAEGWTPRQVLSHIIGAWQRMPISAAFALADAPVPVSTDDIFWLPEWETAPLAVFRITLQVIYAGDRHFIAQLTPADLALPARAPFGTVSLGDLLLILCHQHIAGDHIHQLAAFLAQ